MPPADPSAIRLTDSSLFSNTPPVIDDAEQSSTRATVPIRAAPRPRPELPERLWPRIHGYEIISVIGTGGMGIVYKARHRELNRSVAIKMLRGAALTDHEYRERFRAEAESVARLQHPNIIQIFEIGSVEPTNGEGGSCPFIALEFVPGGSLSHQIHSPQTPIYAATMVQKIARAAHAAHRMGVVHRDLKPANVLIGSDGEPKVADFGLAKQFMSDAQSDDRFVTRLGTALGTPEYMAPEQVEGGAATPAIDIYALGIILYELLTARTPFQGAAALETMELVLSQEPVSPRLLQPGLSRDLETICLKCLQKNPERRYASAQHLADDLQRWLDGQPIQARPVGRVERTARWVRRNPAVAALSTLLVLVALVGLVGVIWKWTDAIHNEAIAREAERLAVERADAERWGRYHSNIIAAASAIQVHNTSAARRALGDAPPEFRNWEWWYLHGRLDASHSLIKGPIEKEQTYWYTNGGLGVGIRDEHNGIRMIDLTARKDISTFRLDPTWTGTTLSDDGRLLAYGRPDGSVQVFDLAAGSVRATIHGHQQPVNSIAFNHDNRRIICNSEDRPAVVWDLATGQAVLELALPKESAAWRFVFAPGGRRIAAISWPSSTVTLWNGETGALVAVCHSDDHKVNAVNFNRGGDRLITVEDFPNCDLRMWDSATGAPLAVLKGHTNQILSFDFNADETLIVSTGLDQTIRLWDGRSGTLQRIIRGHSGWITHVRFSADGRRLVSSSHDHSVRLWDTSNGNSLAVLHGHTNVVVRAAFLPDDNTVVSCSADGSIRYWDLNQIMSDGQLTGHTGFVYGVAMHPNGQLIASGAWDGSVRIWDCQSGRELRRMRHVGLSAVKSVVFHPDGKSLASFGVDHKIYLWETATGRLLHQWDNTSHAYIDSRVAFSPDGRWIAAGCAAQKVHIWDVQTKAKIATLEGHRDIVSALAFSPDGRWLATGGDCGDKEIRIWDLSTMTSVRALPAHGDRVCALVFRHDSGLLASGSCDKTARLWNPHTGEQLAEMRHAGNVYDVAFTPDGTRLAGACSDNTIRFWDVASCREVAELRGHKDYVHGLAFSPNGARLVSASGDFTLRVWDITPARDRR